MAENKNARGNKKGSNKKNAMKKAATTKKNFDKKVVEEKVAKKANQPKVEVVEKKTNETFTRTTIIALAVGIAVGALVMFFFGPKTAKLKDGEQVIVQIGEDKITADELYKDMKNYYSVSILLDKIDNVVLTKLYPEDDEMKKEVNDMVDYYINMYQTYYNYTEEQFLEANGFDSKESFADTLRLDYRRTKYFNEYVKGLVTDKEIEKYYNDNVYGDIEAKYISVNGTDDDAKALAVKVINRLNKGESYESIVEHYGDRISSKNLEFVSFDNDLEESFINALKGLNDNSYTTEPVKGSSDYKVIVRGTSKEKASLEDSKDKIVTILAEDKKVSDSTLTYKALVDMREKNKVEFKDSDLAKKYSEYNKKTTATDND